LLRSRYAPIFAQQSAQSKLRLSAALCVSEIRAYMNYKKLVALIFILAGAIFVTAAAWSLTGLVTCPEGTPDCEGWAILGGYAFLPAATGFLIGGIALLKNRSLWYQLASVCGAAWFTYWAFL